MNSNRENTRDKILADIRKALGERTEPVAPMLVSEDKIFSKQAEGLLANFIRVFKAIDGNVVFCADRYQLAAKLTDLIGRHHWTHITSTSTILKTCGSIAGVEVVENVVGADKLKQIEVGITDCEYLVARTGTIVMSSAQPAGRIFPVYTPIHIVIAYEHQLVYGLDEAIAKMGERYGGDHPSAWYLVSGPSRTGDIEKTLVLGVHGPVEVYVFIVK